MLEQYAQTSAELHRKLNDIKYTGDVNAEYKAFWAHYASLRQSTDDVLGGSDLSLHDCVVYDLSSRRQLNGYFIQFRVDAFNYTDGIENGRERLFFTIESKHKMRDINRREIFDVLIDSANKQLMFMYWEGLRLRHIVVPYSFLRVEHEPR